MAFLPPGPQMQEGDPGANAQLGWQQPQMQQPGGGQMNAIQQMILQRLMMRFHGGHFPQGPQMMPAWQMLQQANQAQHQFINPQQGMGQMQQAPQQMNPMMQQMGQQFQQGQPMQRGLRMPPAQLQALVQRLAQGSGAGDSGQRMY